MNRTALLTTLTTKEDWDILAPKTSKEHTGIMVLRAGTTASGSAMDVGCLYELKLEFVTLRMNKIESKSYLK